MDAGNILEAIAVGLALEWERERTRLMKELLRNYEGALLEKALKRSMLMAKKKEMLAEIESQEKLIDDFMVFIEAVENNDVEIAQNFDEKAMMDAIVRMLNGDGNSGGNGEGFGGVYGGNNDLEVAIEGTGRDCGEGSNAGGEGGSRKVLVFHSAGFNLFGGVVHLYVGWIGKKDLSFFSCVELNLGVESSACCFNSSLPDQFDQAIRFKFFPWDDQIFTSLDHS
ncbi:Uncharacterized protein TCM_026002 [Theobroma cacao]|uniref:Uncharacterized protein n=1 Tax=Theobroma cacao TaxID=3641 RepID=A0A061F895_THECC|nr:Uncharacterized protein TCM_026002 [Theobroma cacao]